MQDDDPYVRKTAAVCVAKLFDINPELVEDRGFLDTLKVCHPCFALNTLQLHAPLQLHWASRLLTTLCPSSHVECNSEIVWVARVVKMF